MECRADRRCMLRICTLFFLVPSAVLFNIGSLLKVYPNLLVSQNLNNVSEETRAEVYVPSPGKPFHQYKMIFMSDISMCLWTFGFIFTLLTLCGYFSADFPIMFSVVFALLMVSQCVVACLYLQRNTSWHTNIKEDLVKKIQSSYNETGSDKFSLNFNLLQYMYQCCGINGIEDFGDHLPPKSCCKIDVLRNEKDKCINATEKDPVFNVVGCYGKFQDILAEHMPVIASLVILVVLCEMALIILACNVRLKWRNTHQEQSVDNNTGSGISRHQEQNDQNRVTNTAGNEIGRRFHQEQNGQEHWVDSTNRYVIGRHYHQEQNGQEHWVDSTNRYVIGRHYHQEQNGQEHWVDNTNRNGIGRRYHQEQNGQEHWVDNTNRYGIGRHYHQEQNGQEHWVDNTTRNGIGRRYHQEQNGQEHWVDNTNRNGIGRRYHQEQNGQEHWVDNTNRYGIGRHYHQEQNGQEHWVDNTTRNGIGRRYHQEQNGQEHWVDNTTRNGIGRRYHQELNGQEHWVDNTNRYGIGRHYHQEQNGQEHWVDNTTRNGIGRRYHQEQNGLEYRVDNTTRNGIGQRYHQEQNGREHWVDSTNRNGIGRSYHQEQNGLEYRVDNTSRSGINRLNLQGQGRVISREVESIYVICKVKRSILDSENRVLYDWSWFNTRLDGVLDLPNLTTQSNV